MLEPHLALRTAMSCPHRTASTSSPSRVPSATERTMGCFVNFGADWLGPGEILFGNRGAVVLGEIDGSLRDRTRQMHRHLSLFEPDAVLTDNIWGYLWGKLAYGAMLFATALTADSMSENFSDPRRFIVFDHLAREVMAVASARAVVPVGFNGFDPSCFAPGAVCCRSARLHCSAGRIQPAHRQDAYGHLPRPCRAQAQDRGRSADRDASLNWGARRAYRRPRSPASSPSFTTSRRDGDRMSFDDTSKSLIDTCRARVDQSPAMNFDFTGKTAIVTGAAHGFGRAISTGFRRTWRARLGDRYRRDGTRGHRAPLHRSSAGPAQAARSTSRSAMPCKRWWRKSTFRAGASIFW